MPKNPLARHNDVPVDPEFVLLFSSRMYIINFARNKIFSSDLQLHLLHFSFRFVIATCVDSTAGSFANKFNKGFFGIEMFHDCIVIPKKMSLYDNFVAGALTE